MSRLLEINVHNDGTSSAVYRCTKHNVTVDESWNCPFCEQERDVCQPSAYSDKPAPLTEERVREIVREEIARAQMTAEQAQDALKRAIDGLVARGIELRVKP